MAAGLMMLASAVTSTVSVRVSSCSLKSRSVWSPEPHLHAALLALAEARERAVTA